MDFAINLLSGNFNPQKSSGLGKQCIQLDDQQKLNHKNPFKLAFHEI